ncbi:hypothetical protein PENTCL1PPCAC_4224, partial [Pristionchus entomophagus]
SLIYSNRSIMFNIMPPGADDLSIPMVSLNLHPVFDLLCGIGWLLLASFAKAVFARSPRAASRMPSSSMLVLLGFAIGLVLWLIDRPVVEYRMDSETFFIYLLAPIIFDAGYFMPNRAFFASIITILVFAVGLTIWNTIAIGVSLSLLSSILPSIALVPLLLFSSLLSASDPVAVIAVFEEIQVNDFLFVHVFGEALFNDAIAVVIFNLLLTLYNRGIRELQFTGYLIGSLTAAFVFNALVSVVLGVVFALLASLLARLSVRDHSAAPAFIYVIPYLSFLTAHALNLSPIITIVVCSMCMRRYVEANLPKKSAETVRQFTKIVFHSSESVVYLFLGLAAFSSKANWWLLFSPSASTLFILVSLLFTFLARWVALFPLCAVLNLVKASERRLTMKDQLILSYSALRGAIAFALAASLPNEMKEKPLFITATLVIVYFNVFVQGCSIRPLINRLGVECKRPEGVVETTVEVRASIRAERPGRLYAWFERFTAKYLDRMLISEGSSKKWTGKYTMTARAEITIESKRGGEDLNAIAEEASKMVQKRLNELSEEFEEVDSVSV